MVITQTPFRISLFGGGTDYPAWCDKHGGEVLVGTIDKYCYLTVRYLPPFFEHKYRIVYRQIELRNSVDEIEHPAVREALRYMEEDRGIEIHHDGDLPARSGVGSSSAFMVGLLNALSALRGRFVSKRELASESVYIEQEVMKETVGSQDQIAAAYGGLNHVVFEPEPMKDFRVSPLPLSRDRLNELNDHLMLFYTGIKRTASEVAKTYVNEIDKKSRHLRVVRQLVTEAIMVLESGNINEIGKLLHESWLMKRDLSSAVSNSVIDDAYEAALTRGALGGKITGAGGGGFLLLFAAPEHQESVKTALSSFCHVPFKFEHSGSQVIFVNRHGGH